MILIDAGNTRLKWASLHPETGALSAVLALAYTDKDFDARLSQQLLSYQPLNDTARVYCAAVCGAERLHRIETLVAKHGFMFEQVRSANTLGLRLAYPQPERFGVDRFLALLAAKHRHSESLLLVSVGTAITADLLRDDGQHLGGVIAPSARFASQALREHIPALQGEGQVQAGFAQQTEDGLATGLQWQTVGFIEHCAAKARKVLGNEIKCLLTGGGADELMPALPAAHHHPQLVLEGLRLWIRAQETHAS